MPTRKQIKEMWEISGGAFDLDAALEKASDKPKPPPVLPSVPKEAEAVLQMIYRPKAILIKKCKFCNQDFGTNFIGVAFCSNECRALDLAKIGISWNPDKPESERWGGEPPNVISTEALARLREFARAVLAIPWEVDAKEEMLQTLKQNGAITQGHVESFRTQSWEEKVDRDVENLVDAFEKVGIPRDTVCEPREPTQASKEEFVADLVQFGVITEKQAKEALPGLGPKNRFADL